MEPDLIFGVVFGSLVLAAVSALVADAMGRRGLAATLATLLLLVGGVVALYAAWTTVAQIAWGGFIVGSAYSGVVGLVALLSAAAVLPDASGPTAGSGAGQRAALSALAAVGAGAAACATDLVTLLIALEITAVCGYALVASAKTPSASEAAMKYFVQGAVVTGLLFVGAGVLVGGGFATGGQYAALGTAVTGRVPGAGLAFGITVIVAGLAFKAGGAPFHAWVPDAYETAPAPSAAQLAGPVKLAMLVALSTVAYLGGAGASRQAVLGVVGTRLYPLIGAIGVVSVIVGSLAALRQQGYRRMLAYAGVAQAGYALIAVAAQSHSAAVFFACTYAIASTGAFLAARAFERARPGWDGTIKGLSGLGRSRPGLGFATTLLLFSLAGIPPLLGFWGKLQAFRAAVQAAIGLQNAGLGQIATVYVGLVVAGVVGSVVSIAYYGSVARALYSEAEASHDSDTAGDPAAEALVGAAALAVLGLGLLPLVMPFSEALRGFLL